MALVRAEPASAVLGAQAGAGHAPATAAEAAEHGELFERDRLARALREPAALDPSRIEAVARVDALLTDAGAHTAALREAQALASLAEAARQCEQLGDVPGAAAWCAEVQRQLGLAAAHAGLDELAESAFRRAVALEPARALLPAEAPPQLVERYEAVRAALASAPEGELRVQVSVSGARVFVDDVPRGVAPLALRAPAGRHVLRVEAPGHRPYGAFVDVLAGQRPALRIALSELPDVEAARARLAAASERSHARAVEASALLDARRGLASSATRDAVDDASPWWSRWYVWSAAAVAVGAGVVTALLLQPAPRRELRVVVEPVPLP